MCLSHVMMMWLRRAEFPTSRAELALVAHAFEKTAGSGEGEPSRISIDEFLAALREGDSAAGNALSAEAEDKLIHEQVRRQAARCTCRKPYKIKRVAENRYRVRHRAIHQELSTLDCLIRADNSRCATLLCLQFGESEKLRLVRVLRSTVMVRVGGGWTSLEEFLQKNDPCRCTHTNFPTITVRCTEQCTKVD